MKRLRNLVVALLAVSIACLNLSASAQRRQQQRRRQTSPPSRNVASPAESKLTGVWQLDVEASDDPREVAEARVGLRAFGDEQSIIEKLTARLNSPEKLSIERRGNIVSMASTRAPRISFEADGREHSEQAADGHQVRTRAVLYGDELMVSSNGSGDDTFNVTFDPIENGRRLRVTRRIYSEELNKEVVVQSTYDKSSQVARWSVYGEPESQRTAEARRRTPPAPTVRSRPQPSPPMTAENTTPPLRPRPAPSPVERNENTYALVVPEGTELVGVLNNDLSTAESREGDRFTLTLRWPAQYAGATVEGYVSRIDRGGPFAGRSEMTLDFTELRMPDGRAVQLGATVAGVRTVDGEDVRVDTEGATTDVQEKDSRTNRTVQRAAIGAAVGSIIGAIAGGGKGAAIGAAIGAGVGVGSVYVQGRDDLDLRSGTELTLRTGRR